MHRYALVLSLVALAGCEAIQRLQNDKILAGVLLETPDVTVGNETVPGGVTAQLYFGELPGGVGGAGDVQPLAVDSAAIEFTSGGAQSVPLAEVQPGYYQATAGVPYLEGVAYTFKVVYAGETFTGRVTAPARSEAYRKNANPPPAYGTPLPDLPTPFSVAAADLDPSFPVCRTTSDVAFVSVIEVPASGQVSDPCFTPDPPTTAAGVLGLLFDRSAYQVACFDVPATCFPNASSPSTAGYVIGLTALKSAMGNSGGLSDNLFYGSGVFAGTTDAAIMTVAP
jgi:hypothetical protein